VIWVIVFGAIALVGLVMVVSYVRWLIHKGSDVMSEIGVLTDRTGQLAALLSEIEVPEFGSAADARAAGSD
jgi:hypothetical protein